MTTLNVIMAVLVSIFSFAVAVAVYALLRLIWTGGDQKYQEGYFEFLRIKKHITRDAIKDSPKKIRDFIYLDVDRLKSLYSQFFEGVAESIAEVETLEESANRQTQSSIRQTTIEEQVAVASQKSESKLLHDHMYNLLEHALKDLLVDVSFIKQEELSETLNAAFMIKVTGKASIVDHQRVNELLEEFNHIGLALAILPNINQLIPLFSEIKELEKKIDRASGKSQTDLKIQLDNKNQELVDFAATKNLQQDERMLESLTYLTRKFYKDGYEVLIKPEDGKPFLFRAVIKRDSLRVSPDILRSLYGGVEASNWTLVGHVTIVPEAKTNNDDNESDDISPNADQDDLGRLRKAYLGMATAADSVEKTFYHQIHPLEITVWPLAIYRQSSLQ